MPTASMIWIWPWPSHATMPIASRMPGTASSTSVIRMRRASTLPPAPPAIAPITVPKARPTSTATTPTVRLMRAPYRTRLNSSRPSRSVPIGCARLGPCLPEARFPIVGSYWAITGARTAPRMKIAMQMSPKIAGPFRLRRRRASRHKPRLARGVERTITAVVWSAISAVPDPRIEECVADVHEQVHGQEDRREDQDECLHDDVVVVLDGGHHP